jgi:hypothetical protein
LMGSGPAGVGWVAKSVKVAVELELDYRLVVVGDVIVYRGKVGMVEVNSVELLCDGREVKRNDGKRNGGGD